MPVTTIDNVASVTPAPIRRGSGRWQRFAMTLAIALLAGCSSPPPLVALLFDVPAPGHQSAQLPDRPLRRTPFVGAAPVKVSKEYLQMMTELVKAGPPPDWPAIFKKLPKDDDGNVQWMKALADRVIAPAAGIDPATPQSKVLDMDVEISTSGKPERLVVFSHRVHTIWLHCDNCHTGIFEMEAGADKITMDAIDDGKFCGVCHDAVALAPNSCRGCHQRRKKS